MNSIYRYIPYIRSNSTPDYISPQNENTTSKIYTHLNVHSSTIYSSQDTETTCVHGQ